MGVPRAAVGGRKEQPPAACGWLVEPPAPAIAFAVPALAPPLAERPPSEQSLLGVYTALAQSVPNTSESAGQPASQARATELLLAQARGPRTQDRCNRGSKVAPESEDCPTKKPA